MDIRNAIHWVGALAFRRLNTAVDQKNDRDMPPVDEIRTPQAWYYMNVADCYTEVAGCWADEITFLTNVITFD